MLVIACVRSNEAACDVNCCRFSDEELVSLRKNETKPDWWKGKNKICYDLVIKIFEMTSLTCSFSGNQGDMPVWKSLLALDHMISLPKHPKNLKRKACKYVEKIPQVVHVFIWKAKRLGVLGKRA